VEFENNTKYSVVIPVFNEQGNLNELYDRLTHVMKSLQQPYEIIIVDDGSRDGSLHILKELHSKDNKVKVISFTRNFGQHPALMAGFNAAQGEVLITLDSDLQNPPEEIPKLLSKLDEGHEVVFGIFKQRKHSFYRRWGSAFSKAVLSKILPVNMTYISAFRALKSNVAAELKLCNERSRFLDALICWMGFSIATVEVEHHERRHGKTKYNLFKLINLWLDMVVSFTNIPLKIAIFVGLGLGLVGFIMAIVYLAIYFIQGFSIPGFATTIILITVFAGIQLFCLGILGEYIGRISKEVKNRPEYIIHYKIGIKDK
jgi:glycosyltransferase involved in cell wall biosynthesis